MNYKEYMKSVEERLSIMTEEEKTKWIYSKARIAKEHERSKILNSLDDKQEFNPIIYEKDKIEKWCEKVEEGIFILNVVAMKSIVKVIGIVTMYMIITTLLE